MYETDEDLAALQRLLDDSYAAARVEPDRVFTFHMWDVRVDKPIA